MILCPFETVEAIEDDHSRSIPGRKDRERGAGFSGFLGDVFQRNRYGADAARE
jgi:hypothetical protein